MVYSSLVYLHYQTPPVHRKPSHPLSIYIDPLLSCQFTDYWWTALWICPPISLSNITENTAPGWTCTLYSPASPTAQRINLHYTHSQLPKHFPVDRVERMHQRLPNIFWHTITLSLPIFGYMSAPSICAQIPQQKNSSEPEATSLWNIYPEFLSYK